MKGGSYFIMLNNQRGDAIFPMIDENEDVVLFASYEEADAKGRDHFFGSEFGYEVFCRGCGEIG